MPGVDLRHEAKKDSAEVLIKLIEREGSSTSMPVVNSVNKKWFNWFKVLFLGATLPPECNNYLSRMSQLSS